MPESEVMAWDGNWERLKDKPIQVRRTTHKGKKGKDKYLFALTPIHGEDLARYMSLL